MTIKELLKKNGITQDEFAHHLGKTREGLNKKLNHGKADQGLLDSLEKLVAKKRGVYFRIEL